MPDEGLPISNRLLRILALNPEEVYRSKEVKKLKEHMKVIEQDINKLSFGINNGVDLIKELCLDLKNKVQLKRGDSFHWRLATFPQESILVSPSIRLFSKVPKLKHSIIHGALK